MSWQRPRWATLSVINSIKHSVLSWKVSAVSQRVKIKHWSCWYVFIRAVKFSYSSGEKNQGHVFQKDFALYIYFDLFKCKTLRSRLNSVCCYTKLLSFQLRAVIHFWRSRALYFVMWIQENHNWHFDFTPRRKWKYWHSYDRYTIAKNKRNLSIFSWEIAKHWYDFLAFTWRFIHRTETNMP